MILRDLRSLIMQKKLLFICDPLHTFHLATDATYLLMLSAHENGYQVFYTLPNLVYAENEITKTVATPLDILVQVANAHTTADWYQEGTAQQHLLSDFAYVMVRNNPPFNMEYYYLTQLLTLAEATGVKVVNNSHALRNFNEKLAILQFPQLIVPTIVTKAKDVIYEFLAKQGDCVIKPLDLMAGRGVFKIALDNINCGAIIEASTNYYQQTVMVQKFIPQVVDGDRRIFIIHGQVIPHALWRIPAKNQIRGNIAAGGRGEVHDLTAADHKLANVVAQWLKQQDIVFAGIDVIGNQLTEINITSPTGVWQILQQRQLNLAQLILNS